MAAGSFTVGLVQMAWSGSAVAARDAAEAGIRDAVGQGAGIVCLQELFTSPYFCQEEDTACFDLAESVPGPTTERFAGLARELEVVIVVPIFERRTAGLYHNTAAVIDATGDLLGTYRKMHIPDDPQFFEKFYFTPGDLGYPVFETRYARVGVLICWDQWYPEAARLMALGGAELICYPTAIAWPAAGPGPDGEAERDAWRTVQRGHAIANGVWVASVNRVGVEASEAGGLRFWGGSFICDPLGRVITEASDAPAVVVAQCERGLVEQQRRAWPFLRDRRIDTYEGLRERFLDGGR